MLQKPHVYECTVNMEKAVLTRFLPVIEHKRRRVGAEPEYWLIIPWEWAFGAGRLNVMALWNFLRLGSTVTIGETATPCPNSLETMSDSIP